MNLHPDVPPPVGADGLIHYPDGRMQTVDQWARERVRDAQVEKLKTDLDAAIAAAEAEYERAVSEALQTEGATRTSAAAARTMAHTRRQAARHEAQRVYKEALKALQYA